LLRDRDTSAVSDEIARLVGLPARALRVEWRRHYRTEAPASLSRDLLVRALTYKLQKLAHGGLSQSARRALHALAPMTGAGSGAAAGAARAPLKPGVRLVRDWHGEAHIVLVLADGFAYRGQRYRSLTQIAKAMTGVHWSGPRFFGVFERRRASPKAASAIQMADGVVAEADHAEG
jgi:hypothetical protein